MSNKEERKAPVLRFKGFTDDWEQRKLKNIAIISDGIHQTPNYVNKGIMFLSVENILNLKSKKYITSQDFENNYKTKPLFHDIFMTRIGSVGVTNILETNKPIAFYVSLALIHPQHVSAYYLNYLLKSPSSQKEIWKRTLHIAFPKKINKDEIGKINIKVSQNKQEQIKIGNLLKKMEKFISLQQRKLKELKQIKGSLLTKILAGKNSNQPILRFRNFKNNWKQYRLKDLYTYSNGKAHEQSQQLNGKYELINLNSISIDGSLKSSGKYVNKSKDILKKNDLVMVLSDIAHGLLLGRVAVIPKDNKYVLNQRIALLRPQKNDENSNFMASLINNNQSYFHRMGSGTSQLNISKSAVTESKWFIPEPDEQLAIGNLLKEIDNYIFLQQDKINQLTALRKFLSQNLFI